MTTALKRITLVLLGASAMLWASCSAPSQQDQSAEVNKDDILTIMKTQKNSALDQLQKKEQKSYNK